MDNRTEFTHKEFMEKLNALNLKRKEFAELTGINYNTVLNWTYKPMPAWVESWLSYYSDSVQLKALQKILNADKN
jgi:phenylalanine-4-hydroxylase